MPVVLQRTGYFLSLCLLTQAPTQIIYFSDC